MVTRKKPKAAPQPFIERHPDFHDLHETFVTLRYYRGELALVAPRAVQFIDMALLEIARRLVILEDTFDPNNIE